MDDIKYEEHKLAEKARRILEHRRELRDLKKKKEALHNSKPVAGKDQLSYKESIAFGKRINRYEADLHELELQILKLKRQLSALELQAQKLLPVSGVKIKVCRYSNDGNSVQSYCIQQLASAGQAEDEKSIRVEQL